VFFGFYKRGRTSEEIAESVNWWAV
jgi:hypothetical protein